MILFALFACQSQYLAIPGATPVEGYDLNVTSEFAPSWSIQDGALPDAVDESVTLDIPLDGGWDFVPEEIVFVIWVTRDLRYSDYWVYEIQPEEREAGRISLDVQLTSRRPSSETCSRWQLGTRVCYGPVGQGIETTSFFLSSGDGEPSSLGVEVSISVEPTDPDPGGSPGECQSFEDCCGCVWDPNLGTNICPIECYEVSSCGCPAGSVERGGGPNGTLTCECPS